MRIIIKSTTNGLPPAPDNPSQEIWEGGYGEEEELLPASALTLYIPHFAVGDWYKQSEFEAFEKAFKKQDTLLNDIWTEVTVPVTTPCGDRLVSMAVRQTQAIYALIHEVIDFITKVPSPGERWIRVE